jgi:hypothetical protein
MTILDFASRAQVSNSAAIAIQLNDELWRVTRPSGEVLGYVEHNLDRNRFVAKRMLQRQRRFLPIGEFWSLDDAMDCFRF